jgi:hypothetical protein
MKLKQPCHNRDKINPHAKVYIAGQFTEKQLTVTTIEPQARLD